MAVVGPLTWLADPWSRTAASARDTVSLDDRWTGTIVTLVIVATASVCLAMAGLLLEEAVAVVVPVGVLVTLSAMLVPLGTSLSYRETMAALVGATAAAAAGSSAHPRHLPAHALRCDGCPRHAMPRCGRSPTGTPR